MRTSREVKNVAHDIIPRKQKHKKMIELNQIAKSTEDCFIVPCLQRSFGFKANEFVKNMDLLSPVIDKVTFEKFVRQANKIIDHQLYEKAQKETEPFFNTISFLLKLSIGLSIFTFTILGAIVYLNISERISDIILVVSIVLIGISLIIAALCPVFLYRSEYTEHDHEAVIKKKLTKLAEEENTRLQQNQKSFLKWKFHQDFFWIQLHINRHKSEIFKKVNSKGYEDII